MGSAASVEEAVTPVRTVLEGLQARVTSVAADQGALTEEEVHVLKQELEEALKVCPRSAPPEDRAARALQQLSERCLLAAVKVGLSSVTVAELLCEALALAQAVDADAVEPGASLNVLAPQLAPRALRLGTGKEDFFLV
ncbi:unnamed protein product [Durusdinium trenchii]|uniref:Uncharacterized protein n=1 Tax=Durusdinium trenchii TaxID=1381693 RepID=A0ABP0NQ62_9DINO